MKISIIGISRRRSKFLAKFLSSFVNMTHDNENTELLMTVSANEDWNMDVIELFRDKHGVKFFFEDKKLGGNGRHIFFNDMAEHATGDWIQHACDDHLFTMPGWDNYIRANIRHHELSPEKINIVIPKLKNTGSVSHLVSRGYFKTLGRIGGCGNIDSWINEVITGIPRDRIINIHDPTMLDYSAMSDVGDKNFLHPVDDTSNGDLIPSLGSNEVNEDIRLSSKKLIEAIANGL